MNGNNKPLYHVLMCNMIRYFNYKRSVVVGERGQWLLLVHVLVVVVVVVVESASCGICTGLPIDLLTGFAPPTIAYLGLPS